MFILYGVMRAGKVDIAPGLFHVESSFGHLYYIPMIPTASHLVLDPKSGQAGELPTSLSFKSILFAWFRAACVFGTLGAWGAGYATLADPRGNEPVVGVALLVLGGVALAALIASYMVKPLTNASYERAVELARQAGFNDMGMLALEIAYGRMTAEQADAQLARIDEKTAFADE